MKVSKKEIKAIINLDSFQRYKYFIKRVADRENIYTIIDNKGDYALAEVENNIVFSVLPSNEFAQLVCNNEWQKFKPLEIGLENFQNIIIDEIEKNNWLINVFSIQNKSGFVVDIDEFICDLADELRKY